MAMIVPKNTTITGSLFRLAMPPDYSASDEATGLGFCETCGDEGYVQVRAWHCRQADGRTLWTAAQMCFQCSAKRGAVPV